MGDFFCLHLRNFEQRIHNKVTKLQDNTCDDHDNQTEEVTDKVRNRRKRNASGHCKCKNSSGHGTLNGSLSFYGFTFYKRVNVAHLLSIKKDPPDYSDEPFSRKANISRQCYCRQCYCRRARR